MRRIAIGALAVLALAGCSSPAVDSALSDALSACDKAVKDGELVKVDDRTFSIGATSGPDDWQELLDAVREEAADAASAAMADSAYLPLSKTMQDQASALSALVAAGRAASEDTNVTQWGDGVPLKQLADSYERYRTECAAVEKQAKRQLDE